MAEILAYIRGNKEHFLSEDLLSDIEEVCKECNVNLTELNDRLLGKNKNLATWLNLIRNCISALVHDAAHQLVMDDYSTAPLYLDVPQSLLSSADEIANIPSSLPFAQLFATKELVEQEILTLHIEDKLIDVDMLRYFYKRILEDNTSTVFDISSRIDAIQSYKKSAEYAKVQKNATLLTDWSVEQTDTIMANIRNMNSPKQFLINILQEMTNHHSKAVEILDEFLNYIQQDKEAAQLAKPYIYPYGAYILMQFRANDQQLPSYKEIFSQQLKTIPHLTFRNFEEMDKAMEFCKNVSSKPSA